MKLILLYLTFLLTANSFAQDTLFYKNGNIKAVKIIEVDESLKMIGYVFESDTLFVGESTLSRYALHSIINQNTISIEQSIKDQTQDDFTPMYFVANKRLLKRHSKYDHGKFSIGLNTFAFLSPIRALNLFSDISTNPVIQVYGEYMLRDHFSLALNLRVGLSRKTANLNGFYNYYYNRETIFEIGLQPTFYANKSSEHSSFYFRPGLYFGKSNGVSEITYLDVFTAAIDDSEPNRTRQYEPFQRNYYRVGGVVGMQFNPRKSISIGLDAGFFTGSWKRTEGIFYENTKGSSTYQVSSAWSSNIRGLGFQGSLNLIYRFGSTARE